MNNTNEVTPDEVRPDEVIADEVTTEQSSRRLPKAARRSQLLDTAMQNVQEEGADRLTLKKPSTFLPPLISTVLPTRTASFTRSARLWRAARKRRRFFRSCSTTRCGCSWRCCSRTAPCRAPRWNGVASGLSAQARRFPLPWCGADVARLKRLKRLPR